MICYEAPTDLKQFTLQNKRLKIAMALCKQYKTIQILINNTERNIS